MLPAGVAGLLPDHEVTTVQHAGFKGLKNGDLLRRAVTSGYQVLLTADRNLPAQRNIAVSGIAVVLVRGSRMSEIAGQTANMQAALAATQPGTVTRVEPS